MHSRPPNEKAYPEFSVRIHKATHRSWQGTLTETRTGQQQRFRSMLELVSLMAGWMDMPPHRGPLRSWNEDAGSLEQQVAPFLQAMQRIGSSLNHEGETRDLH